MSETLCNCGKPLGENSSHGEVWGTNQPKGGAFIIFDGGYGMFADNLIDEAHKALICHDCALIVARIVKLPTGRLHQSIDPEKECCEYAYL